MVKTVDNETVDRRDCFDKRQLCRGDIIDLKEDVGIIKGEMKMCGENIVRTTTLTEDNAKAISDLTGLLKTVVEKQETSEKWMRGEITAGRKGRSKLIDVTWKVMVIVILVLVGAKEFAGGMV